MQGRFKKWQRQWRYWRQRAERQTLLRDEMEFHLESLAQNLMEDGMPEKDARAAARKQFGNTVQQTEAAREPWIGRWLTDAVQDLRYTLRMLRRDASFAVFTILIIGLGIGAASTVFSVVNALLIRPLPFQDPSRLVWVANTGKDGDLSGATTQVGYLLDLREHNRSFAGMAAYFAFYGIGDKKLTGVGEPERLTAVPVSENFFPLLGVQPQLGRLFTAQECQWNGPQAVLLSHGLWTRRFASDPGIVDRKIVLNDAPVTVAGVLPASFDFGSVFAPGVRIDLYSPFPLTQQTNRWGNTLAIIGRLKPGVTVQSAQAELAPLSAEITRQHPRWNGLQPVLKPLEQQVSGRLRPALFVLACAVGVVMLIVCANLSNLQLARAAVRQREMAVRVAVGAGRQRLVRQMLTESLSLACCGAALGLLLAVAGTRLLSQLEAISIPLLGSVRVDASALGFTLLATVVTGLVFGLAPALQIPDQMVHENLKDGSRGTESHRRPWIRHALVVSEVALACVLLVGAGLLIRSFLRVLDVDLGFQPERAATLRVDPNSRYKTQAQKNAYFDAVLRSVGALPGIQATGLTDVLPLGVNRSWGAGAKGQVYTPDNYPNAFVRIVTEGYLPAMGVPLRAGRDFTERDRAGSPPVILINETLARRLWPGENPIGKIMDVDGDRQVVGVVADVRHIALEEDSGSEMYLPMRQTNDYGSVDLVVRTTLSPSALSGSLRAALKPIDPDLPANQFRTLQQLVDKAVSPRRVIVMLLSGFAVFALVLASLGIYGLISYSVHQRTQELGIRLALGATSGRLQAGIVGQTLRLVAVGVVLGLGASWLLARALQKLLFGITSTDPVTFAGMLGVLIAVAVLAGYLPARRVLRIDPMLALRSN